jgi:hypothetical protein
VPMPEARRALRIARDKGNPTRTFASGVVEAIAIGQLDSIRCRGQLNGSFFFGRLIKHLLSGGFISHLRDLQPAVLAPPRCRTSRLRYCASGANAAEAVQHHLHPRQCVDDHQIDRLRQLEEENRRLKSIVADQALYIRSLNDVLAKDGYGPR